METNIELIAEPQCGIAVDSSSTQYVDYDSILLYEKGYFSKDLSVVLNILHKNGSFDSQINDDKIRLDCEIIDHEDPTEVTHHKFADGDGLYTIEHFVIPTKRWLTNVYLSETEEGIRNFHGNYKVVVYYDDGKLYSWKDNTSTEISIQELLQLVLQLEGALDISILYSNAITLCTCGLHECYFHLAMELLRQPGKCEPGGNKDLIYKRDMVWMGINVIEYLLDQGNPLEADLILQKLEGCNGVCSKDLGHKPFKSCGCHK